MIRAWSIRPLERTRLVEAKALLERACVYDRAAEVADELLFGPGPRHPAHPLGAFAGERLLGVVVTSGTWLRLLAVDPDARGHGVGSDLLDAGERAILASERGAQGGGARTCLIRVMDQPGNYLTPGVDRRDSWTLDGYHRRGYHERCENQNLLVDLAHNPNVSEGRAEACAQATGYEIRRARVAERDALLSWVRREFSEVWAFEVGRALTFTPVAVHVALLGSELAAFAAHDGNNQGLGWFGPAGTTVAHRGRGLGTALLLACLVDIRRAGHEMTEIAWIGPRAFYERAVGVAGERTFVSLAKEFSL